MPMRTTARDPASDLSGQEVAHLAVRTGRLSREAAGIGARLRSESRGWLLMACGLALPLALGLARAARWPLTGDEALYAFWARHWIENGDPLFLDHWIDKPPLYLWLQSLSLGVFGKADATLHYVNILASSLLCVGVASFAWRIWGWRAGGLAFMLMAASPLMLAYGPTGLTDPVCVLAGTCACLLAFQGRWGAAGVTAALSALTKQTGLLYLPLLGATLRTLPRQERRPALQRGVLGLAVTAAPILIWDGVRMLWAPSFWQAGFDHYAPMRFISAADMLPRLRIWGELYAAVLGAWAGWAIWGGLLGIAAFLRMRRDNAAPAVMPIEVCLVWLTGYGLLHLLFTFNPWIRYLLPMMPFLALTTAWAWQELWGCTDSALWKTLLALAAIGLLLSLSAGWQDGWQGSLPEMQDKAGLAGMPEAVAWTAAHAPTDTVVLHRELSWHFLHYLFDHPRFTRLWFVDAAQLTGLAAAQGREVTLALLRLDRDAVETAAIAQTLKSAGYRLELCRQFLRTGVYEIVPGNRPGCAWSNQSAGSEEKGNSAGAEDWGKSLN